MKDPIKVGFVTCVQLGLSCIRAIFDAGGSLDCVITLHDQRATRKSGRVYLDEFAAAHDLPLFKIAHISDPETVALIASRDLDWLFIIGWSQIARPETLAAVRRGALGIHPTLLPTGRGRASIPWAIIKALPETGVTMFRIDEGVDTGPIIAQERLPISPRETAETLYSRVATAHEVLMRRTWPALMAGTLSETPQDESQATYWPGRTPEDGRLDREMTVSDADRLVRAATRPYPGAFMDFHDHRLRVWAAEPAGSVDAAQRHTLPVLNFPDGHLLVTDAAKEPLPGRG